MDIGGIGFGPDATDVFMEGLYIPMLKLIDQGVVNETLMAMIRANTRLPIDTEGDTYSLAACNDVGCQRLVEMMRRVRASTSLDALGDYICDRSREAVLAEIAKLPKGIWRNSMVVDGYDAPVTLAATLTISDNGIHVDFDGTSGASTFGINVPHVLHHGLHRVRPRLRGRLADPEQCRLARAADGLGARRRDPQRAEAGAGAPRATSSARCCPTWCSAACARSFPSACRPKARRACGISMCAARPAAAPAAITDSRWR